MKSKDVLYKKIRMIKTLDELCLCIKNSANMYLYGAGNVADLLLEEIQSRDIFEHIQGIYVTHKESKKEMYNLKIVQFDKANVQADKIIVAVSPKFRDEILLYIEGTQTYEVLILADDFESKLKESQISRQKKVLFDKITSYFEKPKTEYYDMMFFSPPFWDVYSPFSAVPSLVGHLRGKGFKIGQVDLGIQSIHTRLIKYWKQVAQYLKSERFFEERVKTNSKNRYKTLESYIESLWFFEGEEYPFEEVKDKYESLDMIQRIVVDVFYDVIYGMNPSWIDFDNCENIENIIDECDADDFLETLASEAVGISFQNLPNIVGISITSTNQFIPGCILSQIIKKHLPDTKIIFGGSCVELFFKSSYKNKQDIRKYFDYFCIGEGETCLEQLIKYLKGENSISLFEIPNLLFVDEMGGITYTKQIVEDVNKIAIPDFTGLDLNLYLAPKLILPYQTSRGCHYGYCAFCNHDEKYRHNYRTKNMKQVVKDLLYLSKIYGVKHFQFVDEAIRPDCFKEMVEEMDRHPEFKDIKWFYYSRVSRLYDEKMLKKAKENGCEMVMFGVETLNQRLLNFIKKGISADTSRYCLELFHKCGIKTFAWLMCNIPSETLEEVQEDYDEIIKLKDVTDAISVGTFMLQKNTDMYQDMKKYNILQIDVNDDRRFVSHYNGEIIDKEAMLSFFEKKFIPLQTMWNSSCNRYTLFFKDLL